MTPWCAKHVCAPPREAAPLYDHRVDYYWSKARSQRVYSRISLVKAPEVFLPVLPTEITRRLIEILPIGHMYGTILV